MALAKYCDNDGKLLGGDVPFVQTKGTISDQLEREDGTVQFRYLNSSEERNETRTFCNDKCEMEWRAKRRRERVYWSKPINS